MINKCKFLDLLIIGRQEDVYMSPIIEILKQMDVYTPVIELYKLLNMAIFRLNYNKIYRVIVRAKTTSKQLHCVIELFA